MSKKPLQYLNPKQIFELDDNYYKLIGKIIFEYSCIEILITNLVYMSLELNEPLGRLSVRSATLENKIEDFQRVCEYQGHTYFPDELDELSKDAKLLRAERNSLAHSKWMEKEQEIENDHDFLIMNTRGNWGKLEQKEIGIKTKKLMPQINIVTIDQIKFVSESSTEVLEATKAYYFKFAKANPDLVTAFIIS